MDKCVFVRISLKRTGFLLGGKFTKMSFFMIKTPTTEYFEVSVAGDFLYSCL